jgi:hypothetical protein
MQFVGRTLGFSLRRKKDFCATIEGHRQKIKKKKTKFDSGFPNKKDEIGRDQIYCIFLPDDWNKEQS